MINFLLLTARALLISSILLSLVALLVEESLDSRHILIRLIYLFSVISDLFCLLLVIGGIDAPILLLLLAFAVRTACILIGVILGVWALDQLYIISVVNLRLLFLLFWFLVVLSGSVVRISLLFLYFLGLIRFVCFFFTGALVISVFRWIGLSCKVWSVLRS